MTTTSSLVRPASDVGARSPVAPETPGAPAAPRPVEGPRSGLVAGAVALALAAVAVAVALAWTIFVNVSRWTTPRPPAVVVLDEAAVAQRVPDPVAFLQGRELFMHTCAACHGAVGQGVPNLGKSLATSPFVHNSTDARLLAFINTGRPANDPANTTKIPMPPKGGNPTLTDEKIGHIIAFVRGLQQGVTDLPEPMKARFADAIPPAEAPADTAAPASADEAATPALSAAAAHGKELFVGTCASCHGADARGMEGLGKTLRDSAFCRAQTDEQLLAFLKTGRPSWDPANTTGVDMPPRGGNPVLRDDDLVAIVSYLRSIEAAPSQQ